MKSDTFDPAILAGAAGLGAVAGLRSMTAPALLAQAANTGSIDLEGTPFRFLAKQRAADIATSAGILELVADKLPFTPNRTSPGPLLVRAFSGGLAGAALSAARKKDWIPGALVGAVAAIAASYTGYWIRRSLTVERGAPDFAIALAEDAIAIGLGVASLRHEANAPTATVAL